MNETPFHNTAIGRRFLEVTMPALVEQVRALSVQVEELVRVLKAREAEDGPKGESS